MTFPIENEHLPFYPLAIVALGIKLLRSDLIMYLNTDATHALLTDDFPDNKEKGRFRIEITSPKLS